MKQNNKTYIIYSNWQIFSLTLLRVLIGWHFLFEGLMKVFTPGGWSAKSYLLGSVGPLAPVFRSLTFNHTVLSVVDIFNEWGLVIIGLGLFIGIFSKQLAIAGILLLSLYYLAYPPIMGFSVDASVEGNYWIVNKILIEMAALFILYLFPSSQITGIDRYFQKK